MPSSKTMYAPHDSTKRGQESTMTTFKYCSWILSILTATLAAAACGSSDISAVEGPNCTALQICCDAFPTSQAAAEDSCNTTASGWAQGDTTAAAATAEANCASAQKQYVKQRLCK